MSPSSDHPINGSDHSSRPPYSALIRAIGEQTRELYPNACWDEVSRELELLWKSYVTGLGWEQVADKIRQAWEDADPAIDRE
jgi:hypothetical protein